MITLQCDTISLSSCFDLLNTDHYVTHITSDNNDGDLRTEYTQLSLQNLHDYCLFKWLPTFPYCNCNSQQTESSDTQVYLLVLSNIQIKIIHPMILHKHTKDSCNPNFSHDFANGNQELTVQEKF